jgi:hypothetical protein
VDKEWIKKKKYKDVWVDPWLMWNFKWGAICHSSRSLQRSAAAYCSCSPSVRFYNILMTTKQFLEDYTNVDIFPWHGRSSYFSPVPSRTYLGRPSTSATGNMGWATLGFGLLLLLKCTLWENLNKIGSQLQSVNESQCISYWSVSCY